jgi:hypothetical protein
MTWVAPALERSDPPYVADERRRLDSWLDFHRATLLSKCAGLTGKQLVRRPVPTSALSLLGLVRHMAANERIWFRIRFAGEDVEGLYESPDYPGGAEFDLTDAAQADADFQIYLAELEHGTTAMPTSSVSLSTALPGSESVGRLRRPSSQPGLTGSAKLPDRPAE